MTPTIRRRGVRSAARQLKSCRSRSRTDGQKPRICDDPRVHQQVLRGTPSRCAPESARQHLTSSPRPRSLPPPSVAGVCHVLGPNVAVVCSDLSPSCSQSVANTAIASRTQTDAGGMCGRFWPPAGSRCQKATRTTNHPPRRHTGWATARTNCSSRPSSVGQTQHGLDATGAGLLDGSKRPQIGRGPHEARAIPR